MTYVFTPDDRIDCWATHTETMAELGIVRTADGRLLAFAISAVPAFVAGDAIPNLTEFSPTHMHYKGGLYAVIGIARSAFGCDELTIYRGADRRAWARPKAMFDGTTADGRLRFAPI